MVSTFSPCIYVASLSDYNAGILHGAWIDLEGKDKEDILQEIGEMLKNSPAAKQYGQVAEEWSIHDYDDFGGAEQGENPDLDTLVEIVEGLVEHGKPYAAWISLEYQRTNHSVKDFEEEYIGHFDRLEDYAYDWHDQCGNIDNKNFLIQYVDWQAVTRDMEINGEFRSVREDDGFYLFRND
jgi:antirestriction protein